MNQPIIVNQLNEKQLAFYHENGYLSVECIATEQEIGEIRALYDRMFASRTGRSVGDHYDLAGADEEGKEPLLVQILQPSKYFPELRETALYRNVGGLIRQLLGPEAKFLAIMRSTSHPDMVPKRRGIRTKPIGTPEGITMQSAFGSLFSRPQFGMAVCISSQVHTGLMSWSISRSGMTAESTVWKSSRVSLISQPQLHVSCRRVVRRSMEAGCCTTRQEILPKTIVARLLSWAVCLQSRGLRQGVFPGSNARTQLERKEHGRAQRHLNGHILE